MQIQVNLTKNDYKYFTKSIQQYLRTGKYDGSGANKSRIKTLLGGMILGIPLGLGFKYFGYNLHWPSMLVTIILMAALLVYFLKKFQNKLLPKHEGIFVGTHNFCFSDSCVIDKTSLIETKAVWSSFVSYQETNDYFFLLMDTSMGFIIPKREIGSREIEKDLRSIFRNKIKNV